VNKFEWTSAIESYVNTLSFSTSKKIEKSGKSHRTMKNYFKTCNRNTVTSGLFLGGPKIVDFVATFTLTTLMLTLRKALLQS
jgi:hypothetical protein